MGENLEILDELVFWALGLLVALTDLEVDVWNSAEFLDAIAGQGIVVRVDETAGARQDLSVQPLR